uniref:Putative relic S-RNase n=1 Tax=Coffea canephora TaxID=49390 RepID=H1ZS19_COFCA|nr:putative relic S-RNase [Coffea canephora]
MMGIVFKLVLLILMLCPLTINSSFQYLTFVQQWPKGYCTTNPSRCQRNPLPTVFTVHGLWPGNFTKILQNCTKTAYTPLQNFQDWNNRNLRWPDLANPSPTMQNFHQPRFQSFWKHEWTKHGTCSENMYPQATYFSRTIQLSQGHNILNYLATGNISPGSNPTVRTFRRSGDYTQR